MRILAIYDTMDLPETKLISGIAEAGNQVVVCYNPAGIHHRALSASISGQFELRCACRIDFQAIHRLHQLVSEVEFDIIHAFTGRTLAAALFATMFSHSAPKILAYRGALGHLGRFDPSSWISFRHPRVAGISCVSEAVKRNLLSYGFPETKLRRIYKGHDPKWYERSKVKSRAALGLSESAYLVCCVANMRPNKGIDDLLAAAKYLEHLPEVEFVLIGSMEGAKDLREFAGLRYPDRISFLGFQDDPVSILSLMDCLVTPTKHVEGFPKSAIEAMCLGIPVIVTAVGGMLEIVRDGIDGLVVPACNPKALAEGITRLIQDRRLAAKLAEAGRLRIETTFSATTTIEQTLTWYKSHVSKKLYGSLLEPNLEISELP